MSVRLVRAMLVLLLGVAGMAVHAEAGFTPLFNGRNLDGWEGDRALWSVNDGIITGSTHDKQIKQNTFLRTKETYADFILRVEVRLENGNSGIQFRSEARPDYVCAGYQADMAEANYYGMLYEEKLRGFMPYWSKLSEEQKKAIPALAKAGDWNQYEIECIGDRIVMRLNGTTTCDIVDPEGAKSGVIALQLHTGPAMRAHFRNIEIKEITSLDESRLMPEVDEGRREKLAYQRERFRTPEGFVVEEVAPNELTGSAVNFTFDPQGRPAISKEGQGIFILLDEDGDGFYDSEMEYTNAIDTAHGLHYLGVGDLLVNANRGDETGLYRIQDTNDDGAGDKVTRLVRSTGRIQEHGPHAIMTGPDGFVYVLYGNHAYPDERIDPESPSRDLREDYYLPRYVDPRGHANSIRAPGGSIHRLDKSLRQPTQISAGYRNAFDMSIDYAGEILTWDSDMEWDRGLPWYRDIRVTHSVPGSDFGWRTGSSKMPAYYIDTLPPLDDVGRGSPVGTVFNYAHVYPEEYFGAYFMGDWSRGRIRVMFPERDGATIAGRTVDFLVGEPLNVTDLDMGPDGHLYFTAGGRNTHGGLFRVRYTGRVKTPSMRGIDEVLLQPMPRSAWGKEALRQAKADRGDDWAKDLKAAAKDSKRDTYQRIRAIEALQVYGPAPSVGELAALAQGADAEVRAFAVYLLGTHPLSDVRPALERALGDDSPLVLRRACEALVRAGLNEGTRVHDLPDRLFPLLDHDSRFVRYAARNALTRVYRGAWAERALTLDPVAHPHGSMEALLALIQTQRAAAHSDRILQRVAALADAELSEEALLGYLRVMELAFIRDLAEGEDRSAYAAQIGPKLLERFPSINRDLNLELQTVIAGLQPEGAIDALLTQLTEDRTQEDQIHTVFALRTIDGGWSAEQRAELVDWFDRARMFGGAASMQGYIDNLWSDSLALLPEEERVAAVERKAAFDAERRAYAEQLVAEAERDTVKNRVNELRQMSFDELAEYLEYDPMAYSRSNPSRGKAIFARARCIDCHVFGDLGRGGGPDLSTVVSRFRRRDILEAIKYPSRVISDQYQAVDVELKDGEFYSGMIADETDSTLTLIDPRGTRIDIAKSNIERRDPSQVSIMPEGLLDTMALGELVDLIAFLEEGAEN